MIEAGRGALEAAKTQLVSEHVEHQLAAAVGPASDEARAEFVRLETYP